MYRGKYEVIKLIHIFDCWDGHLRLAVGAKIIVDDGIATVGDSIKFPARMLETVRDCIKEIY